MSNRIIDFFSRTKPIPKEEAVLLSTQVTPITLKKDEHLYKEGEIPKMGAFVLSGCLREYYTDVKDNDYIRRFAFEDWWIVDMYELMHDRPALCSVQALEDCELLTFTANNIRFLKENCPTAASVLNEISSASKYSLAKNEKIKRSLFSQELYEHLLKKHPNINKRIPLYHIASYLDIKPESLSRIRKKINEEKHK